MSLKRLTIIALMLVAAHVAFAAPHVFWASDPVGPGQAVVVMGDGLAEAQVKVAVIDWATGKSGQAVTVPVIQPLDGSLKFVLPKGPAPGSLYAMQITTPQGSITHVLNRPELWWAQSNGTPEPAPGQLLWLFGKNLNGGPKVTIELKGPKTVRLANRSDDFHNSVVLPADLPEGQYEVRISEGAGEAGLSNPVMITVSKALVWPTQVFNVRDFGAEGQGQTNDTGAIKDAIAAAVKAGGGVVYFPRGRYQLNETLEVPPLVTLKGERRDLVNLFWPDMKDALPAMVKGTNTFAIQDLTFYCGNYSRFLVAEDRQPTAGNVRLYNVTIRANRYRGHMTSDEADRRLQTGGGNQCPLLTLGGRGVFIVDCDLYSSGMAFWMSRLSNAVIRDNTFTNGRWGWYSLSGNDGVVFLDNTIIGGDLMSTGGGLNTLDGSKYSRHVYYAENTLRTMFGWDREAMTSDASGAAYFGKVASASAATVTLAADPKGPDNWIGGSLYIMDGKGTGQYRTVTACKGRDVTVEPAFEVQPDTTSTVTWCAYQGRCLFINNDFTDAGVALQLYGNAIEHILAGNKSTRTAGFHNFGMNYSDGIQPNWYIQWLGNEIKEGNVYWGDHDNSRLSGEAHLGVYAFPPSDNWQTPLTLGTILRGNKLDNNAHVMLGCEWSTPPNVARKGRHIRDVLVENTSITDADMGIYAFGVCEGLVLRGNQFTRVRKPLDGPGVSGAWMSSAERAKALGITLESLAADLGVKSSILTDPKLKSLLADMAKLPDGSPEVAKYQSEALRSLLTAVAQARPQNLTVKAVSPYLGLSGVMPWSAPLHNHLQGRPGGGPSQLDINLTMSGVFSDPVTVTAAITPPAGWQATPSAPVQIDPQHPAMVSIPVVVPAGAWAGHDIPVTYSVKIGNETLQVQDKIRVGSGYITSWMGLGPFPNSSGQPLDKTIHPPDEGIDLTREYDGLGGKIRWTPLTGADYSNGFWPNLGGLWKPTQPATGYLLACVHSAKALPAELRVVSVAGTAVSLNGEVIWSSDKGGDAKVPLNLIAGDNAILLKLSGPVGKWEELVEIGPVSGGQPLNNVTVTQPSEFASRPCFAPPKPSAAPEVGEVRYPGGVNWKLLWADDFDRTTIGPRWQVGTGKWTIENKVLLAADVAFLCYAEKVPVPVRIEYEARCPGNAGDISACWLTKPTDGNSGLLFGFGANGNTINKLMLGGEQLAQNDRPLVVPGKWHHVIAQVLPNNHAQLIVDGEMSIDQPVQTGAAKCPGIYVWGQSGEFRRAWVFGGQ